jgi:inhibitor of nuclear factor kappa-B kinase subunit alpha
VAVKNLHPKKIMVWCAISSEGIFGPVFIDETMKAVDYIEVLNREFLPFCHSRDFVNGFWFMQDGARPHRTADVFQTLYGHFGSNIIGLDCPKHFDGGIEWPACSPDLNPCDFFLWGYLKSKVWETSPKTIPELKNAITEEINKINVGLCKRVISSFTNRLTAVIAQEGGHFEHLYH